MKRYLTLVMTVIVCMLGMTAKAQESKLLKVENYTYVKWNPATMQNEPTDTPQPNGNDVNYYYDTDGRLKMQFEVYPGATTPGTLSIFDYDDDGRVAKMTKMSGGTAQVTEYTYDAEGNLLREQQENNGNLSGYVYEGYDAHGNYTVRKNISFDGTLGNENHFEYTYDADGLLLTAVTLMQAWDDPTMFTPQQRLVYTYEKGQMQTETQEEYREGSYAAIWTKTYTYNADGTVKEVKTQYSYGGNPMFMGYTYGIPDASKRVTGVALESLSGNKIRATWQPVEGATAYLVIIDGAHATITEPEYTSDGVLDGEHKVVVVAIIDGVSQNVADIHTIEVKDQGNVAMENLSIDKVELDVTIYSSGYTVFNYNVYFSWTVPEEASTISQYTLYCDNGGSWVQQQGIYSFNNPGVNFNEMTSNKVSFMRTTFQNNHMDENWQTIYDEGGPDCSFWLTATYESGESPISNIVKLNPYSIAVKSEAYEEYEKTTGINEVDTAPSETERYDLTGRPIRNMRGIVIERQGSEVRKIIRK